MPNLVTISAMVAPFLRHRSLMTWSPRVGRALAFGIDGLDSLLLVAGRTNAYLRPTS